jgi:short subunit dehydrogenase-like uncharacterized protein
MFALLPPVRAIAKRFVYQPGQGPAKGEIEREEIEYRGIAKPDTISNTRTRAFVRARFTGSMYYREWIDPILFEDDSPSCLLIAGTLLVTGLFLAQAAMTVLEDDHGLEGGVYTPACLGQAFIDRADEAGFKLEAKLLED